MNYDSLHYYNMCDILKQRVKKEFPVNFFEKTGIYYTFKNYKQDDTKITLTSEVVQL